MQNDYGMMVASGLRTSVAQLEYLPPTFFPSKKKFGVPEFINESILETDSCLGEHGTRALCTLLNDKLKG